MADVPDEMTRVHTILEEYVTIHDAIFKFSWRKAIPIPGLFKAIDYGRHFNELSRLGAELEALSSALNAKPEVPEVFSRYTEALLQTIQLLRQMCGQLHEKSQGEFETYSMSEYNSDVKRYEGLVSKYHALGTALNKYMRG